MEDINHDETKIKLVNEFFEKTGIKLTQDDPAINFYIALHQMMERQIANFKNTITDFSNQLVIKTQSQLDNANEYFVGNIGVLEESLDEKINQLLTQLDDKNKDLNFVLAKIQGDYDKQIDKRFETYFKKISEEQNHTIKKIQSANDEMLKRQVKNATSKQRDIMIGVGGFIVGLLVCLLVVFILN